MKKISIIDVTLRENVLHPDSSLSFKEKIEIAKQLDKLNIDVIELGKITDGKADALVLRTVGTLLNNSVLACDAGFTVEDIHNTYNAVSAAKKARLVIALPVSSVQMEYVLHKKPKKTAELTETLVKEASSLCNDVEFSAIDATRADKKFLAEVIDIAIKSGAKTITLCDTAGLLLGNEFQELISDLYQSVPALKDVTLAVECSNEFKMAAACAFSAILAGATAIKTSVSGGSQPRIEAVASTIKARGDSLGISANLNMVSLHQLAEKIRNFASIKKNDTNPFDNELGSKSSEDVLLDDSATLKAVNKAVKKLGYELSKDDEAKVYEAFKRVSRKKAVGSKELDTIVATTALQVTPTYRTVSYVINSGNIITSTANIVLEKNGEKMQGISVGDGPIDAAFLAIEQIIGHHYELDDFEIQAVTEGREAMGDAIVKLRSNGKLFSGKGVSTDIIGASIRAYINALNKIVYEENM